LLLPVIPRRLSAAGVRPTLRVGAQIAGRAWIVERIGHRIGLLRAVVAAGVVVTVAIGFLAFARSAALTTTAHVCAGLIPGIVWPTARASSLATPVILAVGGAIAALVERVSIPVIIAWPSWRIAR
jgi:hypothetical protein